MHVKEKRFTDKFQIYAGVWDHFVINYIGKTHEEKIRIYKNGVLAGWYKANYFPQSYPRGGTRLVIGRSYTEQDGQYSSVDVDELLLFNQILTDSHIQHLANKGNSM